MNRLLSVLAITLLMSVTYMLVFPGSASAHERRNVSKYEFVVGFIVEPPFEGQKNGVDFRVTDTGTKKPVEGVEKTVQVEITHVPSGVSRTFKLRTIFRDPGHYTADLLLTAPGYYRMRFFGAIEGTNVNETFNSRSGGGNFSDVESSVDIQFPIKVPEVREIDAFARHIEEENHEIEESATKAGAMATAGIILGAIGTIAGGVSLIISRRKAK